MINKASKLLGDIGFVLLMITALSYLISSYRTYKGDEIIPNILGFYGFTVTTGSMDPTIKGGDYIISTKLRNENIKIGDIITFVEDNTLITHRVIKIKKENGVVKSVITKGDANNIEDDFEVSRSNIVCTYIFAIPKVGYLINYIKNANKLILIGAFMMIYIGYLFIEQKSIKILKNFKRKKADINE